MGLLHQHDLTIQMEDYIKLIVVLVIVALCVAPLIMLSVWAAGDARLRGRSPFLVVCAVVLFFPWGWVAWLAFRPDPISRRKPSFVPYGNPVKTNRND